MIAIARALFIYLYLRTRMIGINRKDRPGRPKRPAMRPGSRSVEILPVPPPKTFQAPPKAALLLAGGPTA